MQLIKLTLRLWWVNIFFTDENILVSSPGDTYLLSLLPPAMLPHVFRENWKNTIQIYQSAEFSVRHTKTYLGNVLPSPNMLWIYCFSHNLKNITSERANCPSFRTLGVSIALSRCDAQKCVHKQEDRNAAKERRSFYLQQTQKSCDIAAQQCDFGNPSYHSLKRSCFFSLIHRYFCVFFLS